MTIQPQPQPIDLLTHFYAFEPQAIGDALAAKLDRSDGSAAVAWAADPSAVVSAYCHLLREFCDERIAMPNSDEVLDVSYTVSGLLRLLRASDRMIDTLTALLGYRLQATTEDLASNSDAVARFVAIQALAEVQTAHRFLALANPWLASPKGHEMRAALAAIVEPFARDEAFTNVARYVSHVSTLRYTGDAA